MIQANDAWDIKEGYGNVKHVGSGWRAQTWAYSKDVIRSLIHTDTDKDEIFRVDSQICHPFLKVV